MMRDVICIYLHFPILDTFVQTVVASHGRRYQNSRTAYLSPSRSCSPHVCWRIFSRRSNPCKSSWCSELSTCCRSLLHYPTRLRIILQLCSMPQSLSINRIRPHPPSSDSIVLGSITRLSPSQAMLSITVVDGVPLPPGEEFTGVIRVQDVRATDRDRVKIGDCFRGGDVVRGLVVRCSFATAILF
jgi:Exosome component EXOSC1/CSL4